MIANTVLATAAQGDFRTPDNFNRLNPPQITGDDAFFEFLFTGAPNSFAEIKDLAAKQQPLPTFPLTNVKMTFNIDATYQVLQTLYTHNVVGMIEGTDAGSRTPMCCSARTSTTSATPRPRVPGARAPRRRRQPGERVPGPGANAGAGGAGGGRCPNNQPGDVINNGADDDGSGTVTELAHCESVRDRTEAEAIAPVHLACRRGARPVRLTLQRRFSGRADRQDRRAAQHGHDRPRQLGQPRRRLQQLRLRRRRRPHQHASCTTSSSIPMPTMKKPLEARLRDERPDRSGNRLLPQRPLQLRVERDSDRVLYRRAARRLSLPVGHAGQDSATRRWRASASSSTRPASRLETWTGWSSGTTWARAAARGSWGRSRSRVGVMRLFAEGQSSDERSSKTNAAPRARRCWRRGGTCPRSRPRAGARAGEGRQVPGHQPGRSQGVADLSLLRRAAGTAGLHGRATASPRSTSPSVFANSASSRLATTARYFQIVKLRSYKVIRNSSVTVESNGQSRTFKDGDHVTFPAAAGGRQTLSLTGAEFVGAGQPADYDGRNVAGSSSSSWRPGCGTRRARPAARSRFSLPAPERSSTTCRPPGRRRRLRRRWRRRRPIWRRRVPR